jgi:hypothetical protein
MRNIGLNEIPFETFRDICVWGIEEECSMCPCRIQRDDTTTYVRYNYAVMFPPKPDHPTTMREFFTQVCSLDPCEWSKQNVQDLHKCQKPDKCKKRLCMSLEEAITKMDNMENIQSTFHDPEMWSIDPQKLCDFWNRFYPALGPFFPGICTQSEVYLRNERYLNAQNTNTKLNRDEKCWVQYAQERKYNFENKRTHSEFTVHSYACLFHSPDSHLHKDAVGRLPINYEDNEIPTQSSAWGIDHPTSTPTGDKYFCFITCDEGKQADSFQKFIEHKLRNDKELGRLGEAESSEQITRVEAYTQEWADRKAPVVFRGLNYMPHFTPNQVIKLYEDGGPVIHFHQLPRGGWGYYIPKNMAHCTRNQGKTATSAFDNILDIDDRVSSFGEGWQVTDLGTRKKHVENWNNYNG